MRKWLDKLTKLQYTMLVTSLLFIWFCICYCVSWAVGDEPKSPSPNDIITFVTLPLTILAIVIARKAFNAQKKALEHQQVLGAWSLLAQKGTGDLGRKDALEFLHSKGKSLAGLDLSNAHLVGLKLNGADLTGCNFTGANLRDAVFEGAKCYKTHFNGANLYKARFKGADLGYTYFDNTLYFNSGNLDNGNLSHADFDGADLYSATFSFVDLTSAHFEGAKFIDCAIFNSCVYGGDGAGRMPTTSEDWQFEFEKDESNNIKSIGRPMHFGRGSIDVCYYPIKLIKTETKNA